MRRAAHVSLLSAAIFVATLVLTAADGVASMPCDGSLVLWCWARDTLGLGVAWLVLHAFVSLFLGWAFVILPREHRTTPR